MKITTIICWNVQLEKNTKLKRKIIQKAQPLLFNVSTYNLKAAVNKWTNGKTSSIKTSLTLHRKGLLTLLKKQNRFEDELITKCQIINFIGMHFEATLLHNKQFLSSVPSFNCYNPACTALWDILFCYVVCYETLDQVSFWSLWNHVGCPDASSQNATF